MYRRINELLGTKYKLDSEIDWEGISSCEILSEKFINEFENYVNWDYISSYQLLNENFIRKYKDKVNWKIISIDQILSWDFMMEFKDRLDWNYISMHQPFIDLSSSLLNKNLLKFNEFSKLYQETKERGWFVGYIYLDCNVIFKFFILEPTINTTDKVRIWWKDLVMNRKIKKYEFIRKIKYV